MIARLRRPWPLAALISAAALLSLLVALLSPGYAQTPPPPPAPPPELGRPANLVAAPGAAPGAAALRWTPAANAAAHFVYYRPANPRPANPGDGGRYWKPLPGAAAAETVAGLTPGQPYRFIVIAGRPAPDAAAATSSWQWSQWSNWAQTAAASPPPPPTPDAARRGRIYGAEVAGRILSIDANARTFAVQPTAYEHFGNARPPNPLTVDYGWLSYFGDCLRPGQYIEAEGAYDPAEKILYAYELEAESRRHCDDDHDDHDDYDDDGDSNDHNDDDD